MSLSSQKTDTFVNGDLMDSVTKNVGVPLAGAAESAKNYLSENPTALGMLLGGAGSGLVGGYLSSRVPGAHGEDKSQRRMRILRNAIMAAGAGAGATGLAMKGFENLNTALPADDVDPTTSFVTGAIPRTLAAGGVAAGLVNRGVAAEDAPRSNILESLMHRLKNKNPNMAHTIGRAVNETGSRGVAMRDDIYHDVMARIQNGNLKNIGNVKGILSRLEEAGGLTNYDTGTSQHWVDQLKRLKNRMFGHKMGPKAIVAGGGLGAAVMAPEIIGGMWDGITGGSR